MEITSFITNDYFKDHDTFKKYPELFITDEYISYIDSLNIKQRSDLCEEYSKTLLTKEDLLENGLINFQKHPELMFQKCLLIYGSKLKYPVNFLEIIYSKYRRFTYKKVYIHYIDNKTGKEKRCFLMRFLRGQALDYQERFGFNPFYNLPKLIDLIFPDKSVSLIKKEGNQIYMECTLTDCPYRTETCYKWHTTLGTLTAAFKKSEECSRIMRSLNRALPQKLIEERLVSVYNGFVLLKDNYTKVSDRATFLCNRQYCPYFNECKNKEWSASVNLILAGNWSHPNDCRLFCSSKGEFLLQQIFEEFHINYEYQKRFENLKYKHTLSFDFYLPDYNLCIEFQGIQHFNFEAFKYLAYSNGSKETEEELKASYEECILRDQLKRNFCSKPENPDLFEIPYNINIKSLKKLIKEKLNL